jgi:hypothetical protein
MTELIYGAVIFFCGLCIGFMAAAVFAVGRGAEVEEFDGGFTHDHPPPRVRKRIMPAINETKDGSPSP